MEEFIKKMSEVGVSEIDSRAAKELASQLTEVHQISFRTDCVIDFVAGANKKGMRFNFDTDRYNIFLNDLAERVSSVQFPAIDMHESALNREEKLLAIVFHEIRHRVQKEGVTLFTPDLKFKQGILNCILSRIEFCKKNIFWEKMLIFEKEEFDSQFIAAVCCYYYRLNTPLEKITDILFWEPRRH